MHVTIIESSINTKQVQLYVVIASSSCITNAVRGAGFVIIEISNIYAAIIIMSTTTSYVIFLLWTRIYNIMDNLLQY